MSPGPRPRPERGAHVVAGAGADDHPARRGPGRLVRSQHVRQSELAAERPREQVGPVRAARRRPVAGAGGVAAVGDEPDAGRGAGPEDLRRQPVVRQHHVLRPLGEVGLVLGEPAQLRHGDAGQRHGAHGVGPGLRDRRAPGPARPRRRPSGCRSTATLFERPRGPRRERPSRAAGRRRRWRARRRAARPTSPPRTRPTRRPGRPRCRPGATARPSRTISPVPASQTTTLVDWVDESTPGNQHDFGGSVMAESAAVVPLSRRGGQTFQVARAPTSCSESSHRVYASANRSFAARSPNSCSSWMNASGSSCCRAAAAMTRSLQLVDDLDRLALLVDAFGVAGPRRDDERRPLDLATLLEVGPDHRDQPLRDAVGALGAQPGQRVAHLGVGEPLDELVLVGGEVDPGDVVQRRRRLAVHVRRGGSRRRAGPGIPRGRSGSR